MTRVATCPQCAAQLSVPEPAEVDAHASCPYCSAQFSLLGAIRSLRSVSLVEPLVEHSSSETPFSSKATLPDRLGDTPTLSTLFEQFRDSRVADDDDSDDSDELPELADTVVSGSSIPNRDPFDFDTDELGIEQQPNIDYQPNALEHNEPVIAPSEFDPADRAFVADVVSVSQAQQRRARGSGSLVRQLVGIVGGGALGLTLGYFALLWWQGPDGDLLGIADRIPSSLLPASFDVPGDTALTTNETESPAKGETETPDTESPSEVEQARFESAPAPSEPEEPRPLAPQDAQPLVAKATVQGAPSYTLEELNAASAVAETARDGLLTGTLADAAAKSTKGENYVKLCQIAERLTYLVEDDSANFAEAREGGRQFFGELLHAPVARDEIGQIAGRWIDWNKRPHGGIFFAGKVLSSQPVGSVNELQLALAGGPTVTVLTPEQIDSEPEIVGVVGSVVEKPADRVSGYTGTADQAVWSRLVFAVE